MVLHSRVRESSSMPDFFSEALYQPYNASFFSPESKKTEFFPLSLLQNPKNGI